MENQNRGGDDDGGDVTRPLGLRRRVRGGGEGGRESERAIGGGGHSVERTVDRWREGEREESNPPHR